VLCSVKGLGSRLSRSPSAFWWFTLLSWSVYVCCRGCVLLVLLFCSIEALLLEASCSWIMIWLHGCCCSKELGVQMLCVDGVVICCTLSLRAGLFRLWWCRLIGWLVLICLCSSWFTLRYCSAFSLSLNFDIGLLVGRVFGQVKVSAMVVYSINDVFGP